MKVLLLGAEGMLGHEVAKHLQGFDLIAPTREQYSAFDSLDQFSLTCADVIINCIGAIPQKGYDPKDMMRLNAHFPKFLDDNTDAMIIQIATDCVFSGRAGSYDEDYSRDATDPYGQSKIFGEIIGSNWLHLRCSIIGAEQRGKKSLFEWVRNQPYNSTIYGYANHYWNGLTTRAFGQMVRGILDQEFFMVGTQHIVPADRVSKYELLKMIAMRTGRKDLNILPKIVEPVNRTLDTIHPALNKELWKIAGYPVIPTIESMVSQMELD